MSTRQTFHRATHERSRCQHVSSMHMRAQTHTHRKKGREPTHRYSADTVQVFEVGSWKVHKGVGVTSQSTKNTRLELLLRGNATARKKCLRRETRSGLVDSG